MKTKEQILEWLDKQPWRNEFYENHFKYGLKEISFDIEFIRTAFCWSSTGEYDLWDLRNASYREWYNSDNRPMSWEEYCVQNPITEDDCCISGTCVIRPFRHMAELRKPYSDANVMSRELCEAFVAYMKLIQLRNAWVKDFDYMNNPFKIEVVNNKIIVRMECGTNFNGLSFYDKSMANEFLDTFRDLLETAKPLL